MAKISDWRMAEHAVGALLLLLDDAARVLPVVKPLAMRGGEQCKWIVESVEALIGAGEPLGIVAVSQALHDVPVGDKGLTRFFAIGRQWTERVVSEMPDEFLTDVRDMLTTE